MPTTLLISKDDSALSLKGKRGSEVISFRVLMKYENWLILT